MGRMGTGEILVILVLALLIFGPKQLPRLGKTLGKAFGTFKHHMDSSLEWDLDDDDDDDDKKTVKKAAAKTEKQAEEPETPAEEETA